jgi:MOSC domain-containing protein YiiM
MTKGMFCIVSLNISSEKGEAKKPVDRVTLRAGHGIVSDAHAGDWHRQVSLLAEEEIEGMREKLPQLVPGDFAENITTRGVDLPSLPIGTKLVIGEVELEVTQIGKDCHNRCAIMEEVGECVMPTKGIFAKVTRGGEITREDTGLYYI